MRTLIGAAEPPEPQRQSQQWTLTPPPTIGGYAITWTTTPVFPTTTNIGGHLIKWTRHDR